MDRMGRMQQDLRLRTESPYSQHHSEGTRLWPTLPPTSWRWTLRQYEDVQLEPLFQIQGLQLGQEQRGQLKKQNREKSWTSTGSWSIEACDVTLSQSIKSTVDGKPSFIVISQPSLKLYNLVINQDKKINKKHVIHVISTWLAWSEHLYECRSELDRVPYTPTTSTQEKVPDELEPLTYRFMSFAHG